jgi:hypothetical protein
MAVSDSCFFPEKIFFKKPLGMEIAGRWLGIDLFVSIYFTADLRVAWCLSFPLSRTQFVLISEL